MLLPLSFHSVQVLKLSLDDNIPVTVHTICAEKSAIPMIVYTDSRQNCYKEKGSWIEILQFIYYLSHDVHVNFNFLCPTNPTAVLQFTFHAGLIAVLRSDLYPVIGRS